MEASVLYAVEVFSYVKENRSCLKVAVNVFAQLMSEIG